MKAQCADSKCSPIKNEENKAQANILLYVIHCFLIEKEHIFTLEIGLHHLSSSRCLAEMKSKNIRSYLLLIFLLLAAHCSSFAPSPLWKVRTPKIVLNASPAPNKQKQNTDEYFSVQLNEFFKRPVPTPIKRSISVYYEDPPEKDIDVVSLLTAAPSVPGCPRPLWLVILASLPTGLLWYGYYKFAVEEELLQLELDKDKTPRGFGGYGTLGPFFYGVLLGPIAAILNLPGGANWSTLGIIFIYYTQFLLYDRVNELYREDRKEEPLNVWWCLPIFFPFNLIVGLRQVHFLSQYFYIKRGVNPPPNDPVADFIPFIKADRFTWQEFFLTPSLWCSLLADTKNIDRDELPFPVRKLLSNDSSK